MADVLHSTLTGSDSHEPKGFATATIGEVYVSNGAGSGTLLDTSLITRMGTYNYDDLGTASSAIAITTGTTLITMTNDTLGPVTILGSALPEVPTIWNSSTNRFDFTDLNIGDSIHVRLDLVVTTTAANTIISSFVELDVGGLDIQLKVSSEAFKSSGTYEFTATALIFIFSEAVRVGPTRVALTSDAGSATVVVNGWGCQVLKRGLV